jgi:hypothetical protein
VIESGSSLRILESGAFTETALTCLWIPWSVEFIGDHCFAMSHHLSRVTFEPGSALRRIGTHAFLGTAVTSFTVRLANGSELTIGHPQPELIIPDSQ